MFRNQFTPHDRFLSAPGDPVKVTYSSKWSENGQITLVESGSINIYDEIQSHRDSVDINVLLAKYAKTGDISILNKARSEYMDVVGLPTSIAGFYNLLEDGRRMYDALSSEQKAQFGNSFERFIFTFGSQKPSVPAASAADPTSSMEVNSDVKE